MVTLTHRVDGSGPPVLLLNGIMMSIGSWQPVVDLLADRYRVVRFDLRGQWLSRGAPPSDPARHADDVVALLDELELDRAHLVGTSFGGIVGAYLAARVPRRVSSLVAIASADRFDAAMLAEIERWREACRAVVERGERTRLAEVVDPVVFSPEWLGAHRQETRVRHLYMAGLQPEWYNHLDLLLASAEGVDLGPWLGRIECPALILAAGADAFITEARCRALADGIPDARWGVIPGAGHAVISEQPQEVAARCLEFLEAQPGGAGGVR